MPRANCSAVPGILLLHRHLGVVRLLRHLGLSKTWGSGLEWVGSGLWLKAPTGLLGGKLKSALLPGATEPVVLLLPVVLCRQRSLHRGMRVRPLIRGLGKLELTVRLMLLRSRPNPDQSSFRSGTDGPSQPRRLSCERFSPGPIKQVCTRVAVTGVPIVAAADDSHAARRPASIRAPESHRLVG